MAPKGEKKTFVAHSPGSMKVLGTFVGRTPSQVAKKVASKGHTDFLIRETGTKKAKHYTGGIKKLAEPKVVMLGGKEIVHTKMPHAKYQKTVDISKHKDLKDE
jgi:hypothetical protein